MRIQDPIIFIVSALIMYVFFGQSHFGDSNIYLWLTIGISVFTGLVSFFLKGTQRISANSIYEQSLNIIGRWALVLLFSAAGLYVFKLGESVSRLWLISSIFLAAIVSIFYHFFLSKSEKWHSGLGRRNKHIVLVMSDFSATTLAKTMLARPWAGYHPIAIFNGLISNHGKLHALQV